MLKRVNPFEPRKVLRRLTLGPAVRRAGEYQGGAEVIAISSVVGALAPKLAP